MAAVSKVASQGFKWMRKAMKEKDGRQLQLRDWCDYLNNSVTIKMFAVLFLISVYKEFVGKGEPVQCWIPAQFKKPWEQYSESYCYVEGTYPVDWNEKFPEDANERAKRTLGYYQWVHFIMILMGFLFALPRILWTAYGYPNFTLLYDALVEARCCRVVDVDDEDGGADQRAIRNDDDELGGFRHYRLTFYYLCFKVINLLNCIAQLLALNLFLNSSYGAFFGYGILRDLIIGRRWTESHHFPRVTFCDTPVRDVGDIVHTHTFQCVLPLNMFNEKIFIFIWWWIIGLIVLNVVNIAQWLLYIFSPARTLSLIRSNLAGHISLLREEGIDAQIESFAGVLTVDMVTVLRLMTRKNSSRAILKMFEEWRETQPKSSAADGSGNASVGGESAAGETAESTSQQHNSEEDYVEYDLSHFNTMSTRYNTLSSSHGNPYF